MDVLTGQVPVWPECLMHDETPHLNRTEPEWTWCDRCGWNRTLGQKFGRGQVRGDRR